MQEETTGPAPATLMAAALMLGAGVLHLLVVQDHLAHARAAGLFFLGLGVAQVAWAVFWIRQPSPQMARIGLAALVMAPMMLYLVTRVWRAPWHDGPEAIDTIGLAVQFLQVGAGVAMVWAPRIDAAQARDVTGAVLVGLMLGVAGYGAGLAAEPIEWLSEPEAGHGSHAHDGHGHAAAMFAGTRGTPTVGELEYYGPTTGAGILQACRATQNDHQACWLSYLQHFLAARGAVPAFDAAVELTQQSAAAAQQAHPIAHVLGHQAYHAYGLDIGLTMRECSYELFQGCVHGALQAYFADLSDQGLPLDAARLRSVCASMDGSFATYVCEHGMGHGVMIHTSTDLRAALDLCAKLGTWVAQQNCYGGVHMENVVGFLDSQRPGWEPHDHGQGPPTFWVKQDDPAYPCNAIKAAYRDSCWVMQTSLILHFNGGDFLALARVCDEAGDHRLACYNGLGREAAPYAGYDPARMALWCSYGPTDAQEVCVKEFTAGTILQFNSPQRGADVCAALSATYKEWCYGETGRYAESMLGAEAGAALCDGVPEPYGAVCHANRGR